MKPRASEEGVDAMSLRSMLGFLGSSSTAEAFADTGDAGDGLCFSDWRDGFYPERRRALNEAHARSAYPLKPYARVTMLSRRFSSQEEVFQRVLMEHRDPARLARLRAELSADDDEVRRKAELEWLDWTESLINNLRPNFHEPADYAQAAAFSDQMAETVDRWSKARHREAAEAQITRLERLFTEPGSPLYVDEAARAEYLGEDGSDDERLMAPYRTAGSPKYRWFNFWKISGHVAKQRALRLNVERFGLNQTFLVAEDFETRPYDSTFLETGEGCERRFFKRPAPGSDERINLGINENWTAIDTLDAELKALHADTKEPFEWYGSLAAVAHIWVIPASEVLSDMDDDDATDLINSMVERLRQEEEALDSAHLVLDKQSADALAEAERRFHNGIAEYAAKFFRYPDLTRTGEIRKDFVMSRVVGGRAILISDIRAFSRDEDKRAEKAIRTIIVDINLTDEQRGRVVKRMADIVAANTLATRGFLYVDAINGVLNDIGAGLSYCYSRLLDIANEPPQALKGMSIWDGEAESVDTSDDPDYREKLKRELGANLLRLRQLSTHLSALNHFITYGITGAALASRDFRKLVNERILALREKRIAEFQTLEEFMRRFQQSTSTIDRTAERYDVLRRRLAEASQLFRAEAQSLELASIEKQTETQTRLMGRADMLSSLLIAFSLIGVLNVFWESGAEAGAPWWSVLSNRSFWTVLIGSITVGLILTNCLPRLRKRFWPGRRARR